MTSDKSVTAGWGRQLPEPADMEELSQVFGGDNPAAASGVAGESSIIFVTQKEGKDTKTNSTYEGVVTLSSTTETKQEELWKKLESVMAARQSSVRAVMEEFGIADVQPASDELEEQLWQVVEGELTLQEAADLV